MRTRSRVALSVVLLIAWIYVITLAFNLIDQKSDAALAGGCVLLLTTFVVFPSLFKRIYRRKSIEVQYHYRDAEK